MMRNRCIVFYLVAFVALSGKLYAQPGSNWRVCKLSDGLPESACVSVQISPQGMVLAKHLSVSVVSELDGYAIAVLPALEGSSRVYGSPAGQLWAVTPNGLQELTGGEWVRHPLPELAPHVTGARLNDPVPLYPVRQGVVFCLLPDQLLEFNSATQPPQTKILRKADDTALKKFSGLATARDGGLWILGTRGLAKVPAPLRNLKPDTQWQQYPLPEQLHVDNLQEPHGDIYGGLTAVGQSLTNGARVIAYFDGNKWTAYAVGGQKLRHAWRGPDQTWWAISINALFHSSSDIPELMEVEDISARQYFDVAVEGGGAFWVATSDGLFRYAPLPWRSPGVSKTGGIIHCLTGDAQDRLWFLSGGSLHLLQADGVKEYWPGNGASLQDAQGVFALKDGTLLVQSDEELLGFNPDSGTLNPFGEKGLTAHSRVVGMLKENRACVRTNGSSSAEVYLQAFDGSRLQPVSCPALDGAVGREISAVFEAQSGDLWVGAEHGLTWCHDGKWKTFVSSDKTSPASPVGFAELPEGRIWCATLDKIWQFDGRDWSEARRGFDRINQLLRSRRDGSLWVASNNGLFRFYQNVWVENGLQEGLPSVVVRSLFEDQRGRLWAGTTHGLSWYDPDADRDPPQTQIQKSSGRSPNVAEGQLIHLTFGGRDKWNLTLPERLLYSYRLDEHDWSEFQELSRATFTDLSGGKHYFQVRAMDRNCNVDPKPAQLEFAVVLPWYKETRLLLISLAGAAAALFFGGLAFNRHRQLLRSYAEIEKKVAERTRELELASRELLHSQKMTALGTLAAGIAHDFNNILSIIKGSAQIIEDNLDNPQKVQTRLDRIKTVVEQGAGIVKAMLGFSRESDPQAAAQDVNAVVEDTIKLLGDRFLREVQVDFQPASGLPRVPCAKDLLQQILLNFIFNAAESMDGEKQIVLTTQVVGKVPPGLVLAPLHAANYVSISVRDCGSGIQPEHLPRIFEPFFTTKAFSARRGTGLGLSMVYELARKLDAGVGVESVVGQGSTFTLFLPVRPSSEPSG